MGLPACLGFCVTARSLLNRALLDCVARVRNRVLAGTNLARFTKMQSWVAPIVQLTERLEHLRQFVACAILRNNLTGFGTLKS